MGQIRKRTGRKRVYKKYDIVKNPVTGKIEGDLCGMSNVGWKKLGEIESYDARVAVKKFLRK